MDQLRCETPEMVRKEIFTHLLAYNLIRTQLAQAAYYLDMLPQQISFKGTIQANAAIRSPPLVCRRSPVVLLVEGGPTLGELGTPYQLTPTIELAARV